MNFAIATQPNTALLSVAHMRAAEASLFTRVDSFQVMHRAASAVAEYILNQFSTQKTAICCGPGNNGGDGWLVAEYLRQAGWPVEVYAIKPPKEYAGDAGKAAQGYGGNWQPLHEFYTNTSELVVDAMFGIGLNQMMSGVYVEAVAAIQASRATVVAVDIPSGVQADTGSVLGCAVKADVTITFGGKKVGHLLLPGLAHVGRLVVADIGLKQADFDAMQPEIWENAAPNIPTPSEEDHKYTRGQAMIYGGEEMTGAARLSALSAARAGAGMVRVAAPETAYETYAQSLMSVVVERMPNANAWHGMLRAHTPEAALVGPGAGVTKITNEAITNVLATDIPAVLDADAITLIAQDPRLRDAMSKRKAPTCMTPHDGEYVRVARAMQLDTAADKITRARTFAKALNTCVLLKGADSVMAAPDGRVVINSVGPAWLATAGSGDVLAGLIAGLAAQGIPMFEALCAAVWLHSHAGQKAGAGMIAEDLLDHIPAVLKDII